MKTLSLFFALILISSFISAQTNNYECESMNPYPIISVATPFIPHASNINGAEGYSATFSYPGFFSEYGQVNFYYTNAKENSYYIGIGTVYLLLGFNIGAKLSEKEIVYMNMNLGTLVPLQGDDFFFSMGISYLYKISKKNKLELTLDGYYHPNEVRQSYLIPIPPSFDRRVYLARGIVAGIFVNHSFTDYLMINFGTGISVIQQESTCKEWRDDIVIKIDHIWKSYITIPLGITLSFHF